MTDITELALRLKLEAHRAVSNFNPQMNIKTRDLMALVEALESEKRICATWRKTAKSTGEKLEKAQAKIIELQHDYEIEIDLRAYEIIDLQQRISERESRTVTVKLPDINEYLAEVHDKTLNRAFRLLAEGVRAGDVAAMRAAGIKVEAK